MLPGNSSPNALRPTYVLPTRRSAGKQIQAIREDWDADDDDDDDNDGETATTALQQTADTNVRVIEKDGNVDMWHEANTRAPMPEVVTSSSSTIAPPSAALRPQLRILKRPSQSQSPSNSSSSTLPTQSTLAQREAQYLEARNRIFGVQSPSPGSDSATEQSSSRITTADTQYNVSRQAVVTVLRDPLGPPSESVSDQDGNRPGKGFGADRRGRNLK